jgi:iron complex outermembrane receptor protein
MKSAIAFAFFLTAAGASHAAEVSEVAVPEITVMGESEKSSALEFLPTVDSLSGSRLDRKRKSTVGETLSSEVGVSSTFFGPNASRPVIRGLDGERIRIMKNGVGVLDASAASQDHAVAVDPLTVERLEIVRGPISLLYGSSAVGGVVNVITNQIPESLPVALTGRASAGYSTVDQGRNFGFTGESAVGGKFAVHIDGGIRRSEDYKVPGFARTDAIRSSDPFTNGEVEGNGSVPNSWNKTWNGAVGGSYVASDGFAGLSYSNYDSSYGTVAEQGVAINMKQHRIDFAAAKRNLAWIDSLRLKNSFSIYKHQEVEGGEVGTTFRNRGDEARLEARHVKTGLFTGMMGLQANLFKFSALGEEAFLPTTNNRSIAAFVFEEADLGKFHPSIGLRGDLSRVSSEGGGNFGAATDKDFTLGSISLGLIYDLEKDLALALNTSLTGRAPNYQELFADGQHIATRQYERGNSNLQVEKSRSAELSLRHKGEDSKGSVGVFVQDFSDFIALSPTGGTAGDDNLPEYNFNSVRARLYGAELSYRHTIFPSIIRYGSLEAEVKFDMVRARDLSNRAELPRITPMRETISLFYKTPHFQVDAEVQNNEKQTRTALNETATAGYTLTNLGVEAPIQIDRASLSLFARANNLFNVEARNHVSILKDIAPLPGRNFSIGVQGLF